MTEDNTFGRALVDKLRSSDDSFFSLRFDGKDYTVYAVSLSNDWICLSVFNETSILSQLRNTVLFTVIVSLLVFVILLLILIHTNRKREQNERLIRVVEALAAAVDAKDKYTNGHSSRVADYAKDADDGSTDNNKN